MTIRSAPLTHLQRLEAEAIHILREVVAECENPVMLYSIGKDSAVMLHLAKKAFYPRRASVSAAARRHHLEVPRDDQLFAIRLVRGTGIEPACLQSSGRTSNAGSVRSRTARRCIPM
jgi:plasmid stability protein